MLTASCVRFSHHRVLTFGVAISVATIALASAAVAQSSMTLRMADSVPETHPISVNGTKFWMDEVSRLTDGQVKFQWFPAQQLGKAKDLLALTMAGTADIGRIGASYTPDKLPLTAVDELPDMIGSSCEGSYALWKLAKAGGGGILDRVEYAPLGLHVVFAFSNAPYEVMTTASHPVKLPQDMKGLKLKTLGGASDIAARKVGAVPVQMSVADLFLSLQRGTVDGRFGAFGSVKANGIEDTIKHSTIGARIGSFAAIGVIGDRVWKTLSDNVKKAMLEAGDKTWTNFCQKEDKSSSAIAAELTAKHGWHNHRLSADEIAKWHEVMAPVQQEWASGLDKRGKPASEVLKAFRAAVEEYSGQR
jgi:TRAP-type C4-dicarboxylate transport system substrate-binding protein